MSAMKLLTRTAPQIGQKPLWACVFLIALREVLQVALYQAGFLALTADEFGRTILAARWSKAPYLAWYGPWLPFHMYFFGLALRLAPDLLWTPRLIVIMFGALSICCMYILAAHLFQNR